MGKSESLPRIAILGASGLIGEAVASSLLWQGFPVIPMARHFTAAQKAIFGASVVERPFVELEAEALRQIFTAKQIGVVVNCIGVLQDGPRGGADAVHRVFVERLATALRSRSERVLLIHISIPGGSESDRTAFSRTKREAERALAAASIPFAILRPGFVVAPAAYGGSALMRGLAMLPLALPAREAGQAFAATDVADIARTIAIIGRRWSEGEREWHAVWDVMERRRTTVGEVVEGFRRRLGGPAPRLSLPSWLMDVAAAAGDLVAHLGWSPPIRSTALMEMRRGVIGNPEPWSAATGIEPASLDSALERLPASVQEKWFAGLYLAKPLVLGTLASFWIISGLVALMPAFAAATAILTAHGFGPFLARAITVASSLLDISIGLAIAFRKTCRIGLLAGIGVSLFYMTGAAVLMPELWIEPLGALVKTGPAVVLMLVALAVLEDR